MIIFSPGPANISERVRRSLLKPDICHRGLEFSRILRDVRRSICRVCGVRKGYECALFTGSGTAAIEAGIASLKGVYKRLLIISNGAYGMRAYAIARLHKIGVRKIDFPDNKRPDLKKLEQSIKTYLPDAVYAVHHETTTGLLNPLKEIAYLAKRYRAAVLVDAISSIAGEELKPREWGIDLIVGSANKCIRGIPGLSFAVASNSFVKKLKRARQAKGVFYLNLKEHIEREDAGQTPFTPAVQAFYALDEALKELLDEGVKQRIRHYKSISALLRKGLRERDLKIYIDDNIASNTMTTVFLPDFMGYEKLHKECRQRGYEIYRALGALKDKAFRLGVVGCIRPKDIRGFLNALDDILRKGRS